MGTLHNTSYVASMWCHIALVVSLPLFWRLFFICSGLLLGYSIAQVERLLTIALRRRRQRRLPPWIPASAVCISGRDHIWTGERCLPGWQQCRTCWSFRRSPICSTPVTVQFETKTGDPVAFKAIQTGSLIDSACCAADNSCDVRLETSRQGRDEHGKRSDSESPCSERGKEFPGGVR
jgi:hypothetical protein